MTFPSFEEKGGDALSRNVSIRIGLNERSPNKIPYCTLLQILYITFLRFMDTHLNLLSLSVYFETQSGPYHAKYLGELFAISRMCRYIRQLAHHVGKTKTRKCYLR